MILLVAGKPMKGQGQGLALTYSFGCLVCYINGKSSSTRTKIVAFRIEILLSYASFTSPVTISKTIFSDSGLQS
jgi:hypothetical protein